ncbi:MAG: tRNA epoxyqueuosine(34) reductase QueG [Porphyromonadaceae bacterium]|jgi:epoxyqueuosine reductase|nr:tRNA epoxyqueuosine(34) reductase QueG [Porphyromonadaceae bacterium]
MTEFIKNTAIEIGFDACGIAKAEFLEEDAVFLKQWLAEGNHGEMSYLERNFENRTDPRIIVEGCKSVVVTLLNYATDYRQNEHAPKVSKYAYSKLDYHTVIKDKLLQLETKIIEKYGEDCFNKDRQHRFVDSAPVLERRWAQRAGLGWIGKNKMLISPRLGSYVFIGVLMINKDLEYDSPTKDRCGTCTKCIDACPTNAITANRGIDARKCISYQTIEKKGEISPEIRPKLSGWMYGCDICNDVCPWNRVRARPNAHVQLTVLDEVISWNAADWANLTQPEFKRIFKFSAMRRAGFSKLKQNMEILMLPKSAGGLQPFDGG